MNVEFLLGSKPIPLPLPKYNRKNSYDYYLVIRNDVAAIYRQEDPDRGTIGAYEIFKIKIQRERIFRDRYFPLKERFPSNEDFGKTAWTYPTLEGALFKYQHSTNNVTKS